MFPSVQLRLHGREQLRSANRKDNMIVSPKVRKAVEKLIHDLDYRTDEVSDAIGYIAEWMHETAKILADEGERLHKKQSAGQAAVMTAPLRKTLRSAAKLLHTVDTDEAQNLANQLETHCNEKKR